MAQGVLPGLQFGTFIARALAEKAGDNADPWPLVDKMFADPKKHLPERLAKSIGTTLCSKWSRLPDDRRALLKLVSRLRGRPRAGDCTLCPVQKERAKAGIDTRDAVILANPYLLYELTRLTADPVSVWTVDRGVFPDKVTMANGDPALQLGRLTEVGETIRRAIGRRVKGKRMTVGADWRTLLDEHLPAQSTGDIDEEDARKEKTAALTELAEARLSVLIGPAGTGKTTLLSVLCSHPEIEAGGILLLAPTGKARVRMEQSTKDVKLKGYTIAQFLSPHRYDGATGRYRLSDKPSEVGARTVIIDEASMLTEEMLAALIQALKGVHRLILIGDPRQLPPIGAGRPFVDIVKHLVPKGVTEKFPRVGPGYAELTVRRRQAGEDREDLRFAEWFSGSPIAAGEDDVFDNVVRAGLSRHVRFEQWETADDIRSRLIDRTQGG